MTNAFLEALAGRHSYYSLDEKITIAPERIREIVEQATLHTPSAFNAQSARAVLLLGGRHAELWRIVKEALRGIVPPKNFTKTEQKVDGFAAAAGTVLFFEDMGIVTSLQEQFPLYRDNFPVWSQQANGMLQSNIWVALELEGLGASLQHYNPLIDDAVRGRWKLPESWKLIAQMPFGRPTAEPAPKEHVAVAERVKVFADD